MLDIQYELPDLEAKGKYVVTDAVIRGERKLFEKEPTTIPVPEPKPATVQQKSA